MGAGETLLLVEDDTRLRNLLAMLLEGLSYSVANAADGPTALSILDERPEIRLVRSDVMLTGGISGIELVRQVRQRRPDLGVLLMSGFAAEALEKAGGSSQELPLLTKPFTRMGIARKIRAVLEAVDAVGCTHGNG